MAKQYNIDELAKPYTTTSSLKRRNTFEFYPVIGIISLKTPTEFGKHPVTCLDNER